MAVLFTGTACSQNSIADPELTAVPEVSPTPEVLTDPLVVCLGETPNTLYPYGNPNEAAQTVLQTVYDNPVDLLSYQYRPGVLTGLPGLADGSARVQLVDVQPGETILASDGRARPLSPGVRLRPAGCRSDDCAEVYSGGSLQMEQLSATFQLRADLAWADGTPVTAADSVYAFQVNSDPGTPASPYRTKRTASYTALDDKSVQWLGIPGFLDQEYQNNFWTPLPQHQIGSANPAQLPDNESAARTPLGYGPYTVVSWQGDEINLRVNRHYNPAPRMDQLTFRVVGTDGAANLEKVISGECHILDATAAANIDEATLAGLQSEGKVTAAWADNQAWEVLSFGIHPYAYDEDGYKQVSGDRPDFLGDERTRQAIAMCLDRQALVNEIAGGQLAVMNTYLPPGHPLFNSNAAAYSYDPTGAANLLREAGWSEYTGDPRKSIAVENIFGTVPFELTYTHLDDAYSTAMAQSLAQDLNECGILVTLVGLPQEAFYAEGPGAPVFGRNFDLAQFPWQLSQQPPCSLYLSQAVPGPDLEEYPYGWGGANISGWQNEEFDAACYKASGAIPGEADYQEGHQQAQAIFAEQLPAIPLFTRQQAVVARPDLCGLAFDSTGGLTWNVEQLAYGEYCQ